MASRVALAPGDEFQRLGALTQPCSPIISDHFDVKDDAMSVSEARPQESSRSWLWTLLVFGLILGSAGLRVAYLAHDCPLDRPSQVRRLDHRPLVTKEPCNSSRAGPFLL